MFIKCWQNAQKRSENVDKTVKNVDKTLRNVHKTLTKRSETFTKRSENVHKTFWKRWQNAQKRSQNVHNTFWKHWSKCFQRHSVHNNVEGRTGHWFHPCVHASWTVYFFRRTKWLTKFIKATDINSLLQEFHWETSIRTQKNTLSYRNEIPYCTSLAFLDQEGNRPE
jgi:hypothetical protein